MTIPTRIVTAHFDEPDGSPYANAQFSYRMHPWSYTAGSTVLAGSIPDTTDAAGDASTLLWTNAEGMRPSRYTVLFPNGEQSRAFVLPHGITPISLDELFALAIQWGVPDIEDLLDSRDASIYGALANTTDPALGDALIGAKLTNDGIPRTVHDVLDELDEDIDEHAAIVSQPGTPGHVDLTTIQGMIDVTHAGLSPSSTWIWNATPQSGDPGVNSAAVNTDDSASATVFYINRLGAGGTDYGGLIASLRSGDAIYIQQVSDVTRWHRLQVTGSPVATGSGFSIPITHLGDGPGGEPLHLAPLFVSFSPSVAGSGIPPVGGEVPDNSVSSIKIVDGSIVAADLANSSVTGPKILASAFPTPNLVWSAWNEPYAPGYNFDGRFRWYNERALSLVLNDTTNNPSRGATLRHDASLVNAAGKAIWLHDAGLIVGDTVTFTVQVRQANGTWRLSAQGWTANNALVGSAWNGTNTPMDGTVQTLTVSAGPILATTAYIVVYTREVTAGAARVMDVYKWNGTKGGFVPSLIAQSASAEAVNGRAASPGLVFDPTNLVRVPNVDFGGRARWVNGDVLSLVADSTNPWGTQSLLYAYNASKLLAGKQVWLDEMAVAVGDVLTFTAFVHGVFGENITLGLRFYNAANVAIDVQYESDTQMLNGAGSITKPVVRVQVPALSVSMRLYIIRKSGAINPITICAFTGYATSSRGVVAPSVGDVLREIAVARGSSLTLGESIAASIAAATTAAGFLPTQTVYGRHTLRDWFAQIAKIEQAAAGEQAVMSFIGDSWVDNQLIWARLVSGLQTRYGNAGVGYCAASALITAANGATRGTAGTWATRDNTDVPVGYGVDIASTSSIDTATPAMKSWQATLTDARIFYLVQPSGGDFRWRVDAGAWTTVATAGTLAVGTVDIPSQSSGSHTITIEVTVAGAAGVELLGVDLKILGVNGVRIHKLGNGGAAAVQYQSATAALWQAALAGLAPNAAIVLLGTNDHSAEIVPSAFNTQIGAILDRIVAARALTDRMLLSPTGNGLVKTYPLSAYVTELRSLAVSKDIAMLDAYLHMPSYTNGNSRNLYANTTHLNANGGQYVADQLLRVLTAT